MVKHRRVISLITVLLAGMFLVTNNVFAQEERAVKKPRRLVPLLSFFVSGNYFAPSYSDLDAVYQKIERAYRLPTGGDFKNYYSVSAGIRYAPVSLQFIEIEGSGSFYKSQPSVEGQSNPPTNFIRLYSATATYLVRFPISKISILAGGGAGMSWLRSERSYPSKAIARVNGELMELHGLVGFEYFHPSGASFGAKVGYSYSTTMHPKNADCDFTLKGLTIKIGANVPLIRI